MSTDSKAKPPKASTFNDLLILATALVIAPTPPSAAQLLKYFPDEGYNAGSFGNQITKLKKMGLEQKEKAEKKNPALLEKQAEAKKGGKGGKKGGKKEAKSEENEEGEGEEPASKKRKVVTRKGKGKGKKGAEQEVSCEVKEEAKEEKFGDAEEMDED